MSVICFNMLGYVTRNTQNWVQTLRRWLEIESEALACFTEFQTSICAFILHMRSKSWNISLNRTDQARTVHYININYLSTINIFIAKTHATKVWDSYTMFGTLWCSLPGLDRNEIFPNNLGWGFTLA